MLFLFLFFFSVRQYVGMGKHKEKCDYFFDILLIHLLDRVILPGKLVTDSHHRVIFHLLGMFYKVYLLCMFPYNVLSTWTYKYEKAFNNDKQGQECSLSTSCPSLILSLNFFLSVGWHSELFWTFWNSFLVYWPIHHVSLFLWELSKDGLTKLSWVSTGKLLAFFPAEGGWLAPYLLVHLEFHSCHLSFYAVDKNLWLGGGRILIWQHYDLSFTKCLCHEPGVNLFFFSCSMWNDRKGHQLHKSIIWHWVCWFFKFIFFPIHFAKPVTVSHQ